MDSVCGTEASGEGAAGPLHLQRPQPEPHKAREETQLKTTVEQEQRKTVKMGKVSAPPVYLQLQNRHRALALVRTNTQQGMHQSQLRLHLMSAKRGKASSSGGRLPPAGYGGTHLLTGPGILGGLCLLGTRMLQRDWQGLPSLQTITLLLFHMGINDTAKEVLESIKSD